jgi:FAD:protein FMN transferase
MMTVRDTRLIMGMPITIEIACDVPMDLLDRVYDYFMSVDQRFSLYKADSEISAHNRGEVGRADLSKEMLEVMAHADRTRAETNGYFEIKRADGTVDPSGIVKGWAVRNAARMIRSSGIRDFYVDAGGDIQTGGRNGLGEEWRVGIRNPFNEHEIVKAVAVSECGIATSGTYVRGQHIYNPHRPGQQIDDIVSMTIIAADVLEADRFATAAFAMGGHGIYFVEESPGIEGYVISSNGISRQTSGFGKFVIA